MANRSIRDSQRGRVYRSENIVFYGSPEVPDIADITPDFQTVAECQTFVDYVTASDAWRSLDAPLEVEVKDGRGSGRARACVECGDIMMPKWTRDRYQLLHELAHIAVGEDETVASHGPEYTGIYLFLVRTFLGEKTHDASLAAFVDNRVKVHHIEPLLLAEKPQAPELITAMTDIDTHYCSNCGRTTARGKFCSDACRYAYHNRRRHLRTAATWDKVCEVCGTEFVAPRGDTKTCSPACSQKAYRQRSRAF